jgi:outer membrane protein assembly complex protein YaeT
VTFNADRTLADLDVRVHEGPLYRVTAVTIEGDAGSLVETALEPLRRQWDGQPYHPRLKLILKNQLEDVLGDRGYAEARVTVIDRREANAGRMELLVSVESGPQVAIESVVVEGNQKTRESFIRRRLTLQSGDRFSRQKLRESSSNLYRSGLFRRVDLTLAPGSTPELRKLVVMLEETPSQEVFVEPGWGSYELLMLSLGLNENNLLGTGRRLGLTLGGSLRARRAVLRYTDPWFLESSFTADLPIFYSYREEPSFTRTDYGGNFDLSRDLTPHLSATAGYGLRKTKQSDVDVDPEDVDADQTYDLASLKLHLNYDDRDDPFYPTQGAQAFVGLQYAAAFLGGSVDFSRFTTGVRYFQPLGWDAVLGMRYTTGFIVPSGDTINVPLAERFFNGGENSVRSFKEQELGPKDESNNPVGGMAFNTINIELRRRLTESLYGSLFADFGNVAPNRSRSEQGKDAYRSQSSLISATFNDYFSDMRPGFGVGLGYLLPIGPARVDWAFNPDADKKRDEDDWVLHFSIGMAF